jgi:hypothetical protein
MLNISLPSQRYANLYFSDGSRKRSGGTQRLALRVALFVIEEISLRKNVTDMLATVFQDTLAKLQSLFSKEFGNQQTQNSLKFGYVLAKLLSYSK